jgi:hypothetical protein
VKRTALTLVATSLVLWASSALAGAFIPQPPEREPSLAEISEEMAAAHRKLEAEHHGGAVQVVQKKVAEDLDRLIEKLEKLAQQPPGAPPGPPKPPCGPPGPNDGQNPAGGPNPTGGLNPQSPMQRPFMTRGQVRHGPKATLSAVGADWGKLPGSAKRQILQTMDPRFPSRYVKPIVIYLMYLGEEGRR